MKFNPSTKKLRSEGDEKDVRIAIVLGSIRKIQEPVNVVACLVEVLENQGVLVDCINLQQLSLTLPETGVSAPGPGESIRKRIENSDAIILVSPEYQGNITGTLKNVLDGLADELYRKPVGVVTTSTGKFGSLNVFYQLQHIILSIGGYVIPQQCIVSRGRKVFDAGNKIADEYTFSVVDRFLNELMWLTEALMVKKDIFTVY